MPEEVLCPICDNIIPIVHPDVAQCSGCGRRFELDWDADQDGERITSHLTLVFSQLGQADRVFRAY